MELVYESKKLHRKLYSKVKIPKKKGDYLYLIKIGETYLWHKIGTTNRIMKRMEEHFRFYDKYFVDKNKVIIILWISPPYSKWTTLRIEDKMKKLWITEHTDWRYEDNDRFVIPNDVKEITIEVRKKYVVEL